VIAAWEGRFRCVTTSLLGYGRTAERRTADDPCISHEAEILEAVIRKTGGPVHLVLDPPLPGLLVAEPRGRDE